tara:strand:+ start:14039 stop:14317 length:279 start_codon:yes stop_codon:yes gene_type:complete
MIKKLTIGLSLVLLAQGCTWYGEFEHVSSIPNGNPFNDRKETSVDAIWTGIKVEKNGWYVDSAVGWDTSGEYEGRNPYGRFKVGKEIKKWGE